MPAALGMMMPARTAYPPTAFPGLEAWYAAPPRGVDPAAYVQLVKPAVVSPGDMTVAPWTLSHSTIVAAGTSPAGDPAFRLTEVGDGASVLSYYVRQILPVDEQVLSTSGDRVTVMTVDVNGGTRGFCWVWIGHDRMGYYDLTTGQTNSSGAPSAVATMVALGGGWWRCRLVADHMQDASITIGLSDALLVIYYVVPVGAGKYIDVANMTIEQDGTCSIIRDLSGNGNDAPQASNGRRLWYRGALEQDWGADPIPSIANMVGGSGTGQISPAPAGLLAALSGLNQPWEGIALVKTYVYPPINNNIVVSFGGLTATSINQSLLIIEFGHATAAPYNTWITYWTDGSVGGSNYFTGVVPAGTQILSSAFSGAVVTQRHGSPPLVAYTGAMNETVAFNLTSLYLLQEYAAGDTSAFREIAIFSRVLTDGERAAVMAGMLARAV